MKKLLTQNSFHVPLKGGNLLPVVSMKIVSMKLKTNVEPLIIPVKSVVDSLHYKLTSLINRIYCQSNTARYCRKTFSHYVRLVIRFITIRASSLVSLVEYKPRPLGKGVTFTTHKIGGFSLMRKGGRKNAYAGFMTIKFSLDILPGVSKVYPTCPGGTFRTPVSGKGGYARGSDKHMTLGAFEGDFISYVIKAIQQLVTGIIFLEYISYLFLCVTKRSMTTKWAPGGVGCMNYVGRSTTPSMTFVAFMFYLVSVAFVPTNHNNGIIVNALYFPFIHCIRDNSGHCFIPRVPIC